MMSRLDKTLREELLLFNKKYKINQKEYFKLLELLRDRIESDNFKDLKDLIKNFKLDEDLDKEFNKEFDFQKDLMTNENVKLSDSKVFLIGLTFVELIKEFRHKTKLNLIRDIYKNLNYKKLTLNQLFKFKKEYKYRKKLFFENSLAKSREIVRRKEDSKLELKGWISIAILDKRTSALCANLHNKFYSIKDYKSRDDLPNPIPRHPNCRSIHQSILKNESIKDYKKETLYSFLKRNKDAGESILGTKKYSLYMKTNQKIKIFNINTNKLLENKKIKELIKKGDF